MNICLVNLHIYGSSVHMCTRTHTHVHTHTHICSNIHMLLSAINIYMCVCVCTCVCCFHKYASYQDISNSNNMGHMSLIQGGEDSQDPLNCTSFSHNRATKYKSLLRKMTYKDKGSYESKTHRIPYLYRSFSAKMTYMIATCVNDYQPRHITWLTYVAISDM